MRILHQIQCSFTQDIHSQSEKVYAPNTALVHSINQTLYITWVKVQNFQNPELLNSNFKTCRLATKMDNLLCLNKLKTNQRSYNNLLNSAF